MAFQNGQYERYLILRGACAAEVARRKGRDQTEIDGKKVLRRVYFLSLYFLY